MSKRLVVALSGGVGGAKLALGLSRVLPAENCLWSPTPATIRDMKLGRLGVWYSTDKLDGSQLRDFVRTVEKNGYSNLWYPESRGYELMSLAAWLLSSSEKLVIGSSIANIYARDSFTAQRAMISLNTLYGDRFILGLGVSHIPMVEGLRGHRYEKPLAAMSAYLDGINKSAPAGELPPVVVAALGPKMLALSGCQVAWRCPI